MTKSEYAELIRQLPEHLFNQYGFTEPYDYSKQPYISTSEYDYYPDIQTVIINGIAIVWDSFLPYIDPSIPEHLAELQKRVSRRLHPDLIGIIGIGRKTGTMECRLYNSKKTDTPHLKAISFDNTYIYYNPNTINLQNDHEMQLLAKCLFAGRKYEQIYIVPEKGQKPSKWKSS